ADLILKQAAIEIQNQQPMINNLVNRILTGDIDLIVFFTTFGFEHFWERAIRVADEARMAHALCDIRAIVGSDSIQEKLAEREIVDSVSSFSNWRELLVYLDQNLPVGHMTVAIEDSREIHGVAAGIEARGGTVVKIPRVEFEKKDPTADEQDLIDAIEDGDLGTILLPNPICGARFEYLVNQRSRPKFQNNVRQLVVMALGDETKEWLSDGAITCDVVISESQLQREIQQSVNSIRVIKARNQHQLSNPNSGFNDMGAPWFNNPFMKAIRLEPVEVTPIWMMRQAGRYMQEYREVRAKVPFLELCKRPQLCSEVMCTAVEKLGVDAAIIFSDLLPILEPMGCHLEYLKGDGPVIHNPVRTGEDIHRIVPLENNEALQFVMETVRQTRLDLPADMPLIGFAGAPFSLASYMIEGKSNRHYAHTKKIMFGDHGAWDELMSKLTDSIIVYLTGQIEAGAQCVQLFDSWAGCLSVFHYQKFVAQYVNRIIDAISPLATVMDFQSQN
ncbi:MAG: uroporphyrinogen decarboxylase family protein, partial [Planctomycetota bacterium]